MIPPAYRYYIATYPLRLMIPTLGLAQLASLTYALNEQAWLLLLDVGLVLAGITMLYIAERHGRSRMCPDCAAPMPLDPQRSAEQHHRALWFAHRNPRVELPLMLILAGSYVAGSPWNSVSALLHTLLIAVWCGIAWSRLQHRQLAPWCPYCHGDDNGGDDDDSPVPTPPEPSAEHTPRSV